MQAGTSNCFLAETVYPSTDNSMSRQSCQELMQILQEKLTVTGLRGMQVWDYAKDGYVHGLVQSNF